MPSGDYSPDVRFDTQALGRQSWLERRLWKNNHPGYRLALHLLVTQNLSQAIKQPTLRYLTRSVRRRAATSKRASNDRPIAGGSRLIVTDLPDLDNFRFAIRTSWRAGLNRSAEGRYLYECRVYPPM